ncbi:type II toxin-antitoxin system HicB family antitoxin [Anaerovibrio sp. RM50]|uniref:type II toxin-antitoxin system HicB family antitoxin n=1 Tax=Anaerovibrio sp. RM50 TaxID=1200557 RepID=UPI0018DCD026|nr:type II toxin-antitoxin system HicB family antitoxin [Anaerovibrio sp. RM50]
MMYKGYIGKAAFDEEQHIFTGEVINTRTVITFQGESVKELEAEFKASVDDYLEWCQADGIDPEKPFSGKINVRFQPELHRRASIAAKLQGISLNTFIADAVNEKICKVAQTGL